MSSTNIAKKCDLPLTPICVSNTIPDHIKSQFGDPPSLENVLEALEVLYDDFCFIYLSFAGTGYPGPMARETELAKFVTMLYDFTYYRHCDTNYIAQLCNSTEMDLSDDGCDYIELQIAATHLHRLLQSVRYQTFVRAGEGTGKDRDPLIDVIAHFIQLAYTQFRVEFGTEGFYQADSDLMQRLKSAGCDTGDIFSNQEVEFISSCAATTISKEIKNGDKLVKVSAANVVHWSRYSDIPDHVFPRRGNEVGNRQAFVTRESLQTWLAGRLNFQPTQFVCFDNIPKYTSPTFFRDTYLSTIKKQRIQDVDFCRLFNLSEHHLRLLQKGKRPLFFRQASIIDNYLYGLGSNPYDGNHQSFPLFNELVK